MSDNQEQVDGTENQTEEQIEEMRSEIGRLRQENAMGRQQFERMSQAFSGKNEEQIDPDEEWENSALAQFLEAEKSGQKLPISEALFKQIHKITTERKSERQKLAELERTVNQLSNPETRINQNTYAIIDDKITRDLEEIYGEDQPMVSDAVRAEVIETIRYMQKENPKMWEMVRREPSKIERIVNHAISQIIPPNVKQQLIETEQENAPVTANDLREIIDWTRSEQFYQLPEKERREIKGKLTIAVQEHNRALRYRR